MQRKLYAIHLHRDMFISGYTIPKGWALMVVPAAIQLNSNIYEDPLTFNPWRWQVGRFFFPGWKKEKKRKKALAYLSVTMHDHSNITCTEFLWDYLNLSSYILLNFTLN
jgi:hypothetical protein